MSEEFDPRAAIEGIARTEAFNDQLRRPNPNGRYPRCKPKLFDARVCERCNGTPGNYPCPAVPPAGRWGEDSEGEPEG